MDRENAQDVNYDGVLVGREVRSRRFLADLRRQGPYHRHIAIRSNMRPRAHVQMFIYKSPYTKH